MDVTGFCVVQTSIDDEAEADRIAAALIDKKLAACVQIVRVKSHYVWKGEKTRQMEYQLSAKARARDFAAIAEAIRALHPYELPEIISLPIRAADSTYIEWVRAQTRR